MMLGAVACSGPAWSPETATVLYTSRENGDSELFVWQDHRGQPTNVTRTLGQDHWGSWSPEGRRIVFQTLRDGNREVYVMNADGSDPVNLTRDPAEDLLPEWSPDGTRILFFSTRGHERGPRGEFVGNLWLMSADGSDQRRLTATPLSSSFMGTWSPDGRTIVFSRSVDGTTDLFLMDADGTNERPLTATPESEGGARYSPDGRLIAFDVSAGEERRIAVMNADGSGRRVVTEGGQHYQPAWSPDGRWLLFTGGPLAAAQLDLLAVPATGGSVVPIVSTAEDERSGSWRR
jgi:TolB protein